MRKYSDIVKSVQKKKKSSKNIPQGYTLLYYDKNRKFCQYQNFPPELLMDIENKYERFRLRNLYLKDIDRLVQYRIADLEKDNHDYTIEDVLNYWGYYDDEDNDSFNDVYDDNNSGDSDYYSD